MAYTFPLPLNQFFNDLPIRSVTFGLGEALEHNETAGGEIISASLGSRLWRAEIAIEIGYYAQIEQVKARLDMLRYPGRPLLVHPLPLSAPQYDPTGTILGASTVQLMAVQSNNREIRLEGLPEDYEIRAGDFLGWTYGSNPTRYALHQVANGSTANGSGQTGLIELSSFVRVGYSLGATVTLIKPAMKAIVVPGTVDSGVSQSKFTNGVKFSVIQTLR